jgi:protein-tyrosine-phosphatase
LHVTFICSGNICRSPMAEKMFAHQIETRGLSGAVRVTSAGTGGWHAGEPADNRASHVLRGHGYPTAHRAAQVGDDHLSADLVIALGRNHLRMLQEMGVPTDRVRMLRSFDPRSGAHALDVEDPYYGTHDDFEDVFTVIDAAPAFEVLVPFVVEGGPTVLVDRGYVRPVQGSKVPAMAPPPSGSVTITARLRDSEPVAPGKEPFREDGTQQVYSISTTQITAVTGVPLAGSYLQLTEDQPGGLGVIPLPHLEAGPFLSYGIQWIAFGIIAPIGLGYFVYSEVKQRRREKAAKEAADAAPSAPLTAEEKLADRYGRRR